MKIKNVLVLTAGMIAASLQLVSCDSSTSSDGSGSSSTSNSGTGGSGGNTSGSSASGTFTDSRDGQSYKYVKIGSQTWMAQNLNYRNTTGKSDTVGVCYNGLSSNCTTYGRLYTWSEVMAGSSSSTSIPSGVQGICPSGWHVPSDAEWSTLVQYVDSASGTKLKANSALWSTNTGTDVYGFSVLPAGYRNYDGTFRDLGGYADFWSSSESDASSAWYRDFHYNGAHVTRSYSSKAYGFSLRCAEN